MSRTFKQPPRPHARFVANVHARDTVCLRSYFLFQASPELVLIYPQCEKTIGRTSMRSLISWRAPEWRYSRKRALHAFAFQNGHQSGKRAWIKLVIAQEIGWLEWISCAVTRMRLAYQDQPVWLPAAIQDGIAPCMFLELNSNFGPYLTSLTASKK